MKKKTKGTTKDKIIRPKAKPGDKRIGNCFYLKRSRIGTNRIFESAEDMIAAATEYFQACDENPIFEVDYRGKDVQEVRLPKHRVYTYQGLCVFLGVNTDYFNDFRARVRDKQDETSKAFTLAIKWIDNVIYQNKFEKAACGILNPMIISRDLGLKDQVENKVDASDQFLEMMKRAGSREDNSNNTEL